MTTKPFRSNSSRRLAWTSWASRSRLDLAKAWAVFSRQTCRPSRLSAGEPRIGLSTKDFAPVASCSNQMGERHHLKIPPNDRPPRPSRNFTMKLSIAQALHTLWLRQVYNCELSRGRGATETVVDRCAKPLIGNRRDCDARLVRGVRFVEQIEQVPCGFEQIA